MHKSSNRAYTSPVSTLSNSDYIPLLKMALTEDAPDGDITSESLFSESRIARGSVVSREEGVLCGIGVISALQELYPDEIRVLSLMEDGSRLSKGSEVVCLEARARFLLRIERVLLNFMQYLSGIASETNRIVRMYPNLHILDTRKTLPGYRKLVKYCVYKGGGWNHRINLSDMAMIKDNHLAATGSIPQAVDSIRQLHPNTKLELEIDSLEQLADALSASPDIILLDNFTIDDTRIAVGRIRENNPSINIEVSGGVTPEKLEFLSNLGSIGVSMGYLTHTTRFLDLGLDLNISDNIDNIDNIDSVK